MITILTPAALIAVTAFGLVSGPTDTPIEPIPVDVVEIVLQSDRELCPALGELGGAITLMLDVVEGVDSDPDNSRPAVEATLTDALVDWAADMLEDGLGDNYALTPEAETYFETWATGCLVLK